ncbi:MAG: ABC transporter permease, partial [Clostridia bacterium]|nr:ABC transporter permease [Clostridia bacterium]
RDTQFLWSVVVMMLNFLTPIFYPESIIPARFMTVYHMNPLYQIIYFMRCILIKGVSPTPISYLYCLISCGVPLALGIIIFKRHQDQFVLHL